VKEGSPESKHEERKVNLSLRSHSKVAPKSEDSGSLDFKDLTEEDFLGRKSDSVETNRRLKKFY